MKIFKKIITILMIVVLLSGCAAKKYDDMSIDKKKNVTFKTTIMMDDELLDSILKISSADQSRVTTDEDRWNYLDSVVSKYTEWNKEKYQDGSFKGYVLTYKNQINLDDISTSDDASGRYVLSSNTDFSDSHMFIKKDNIYKTMIKVMPPDEYSALHNNESQGEFEMIYTLELPNKSISNNADKVSWNGKTLSWYVQGSRDIDVEFEVKKTSILTYIIVGLIVIIFVISIVFMIKRKK